MKQIQPLQSRIKPLASLLLLVLISIFSNVQAAATEDGHRLVGLLAYINADYAGAVQNGKVLDDFEFKEMQQLAKEAVRLSSTSPSNPKLLETKAQSLLAAIQEKKSVAEIKQLTSETKELAIENFGIQLTPRHEIELANGKQIFEQNCASCHGIQGFPDPKVAATMDPPPVNFHEPGRRQNLSPYRVYNASTFGISGTSMKPFDNLSEDEKWNLAFYVLQLAHTGAESEAEESEAKIAIPARLRPTVDDLAVKTDIELTDEFASEGFSPEDAKNAVSYLRKRNPNQWGGNATYKIEIIQNQIQKANELWKNGESKEARNLVLSAYLDNFEPLEARLSTLDRPTVLEVEKGFLELRASMESNEDTEKKSEQLVTSLEKAKEVLSASRKGESFTLAAAGAVIMLREGVEVVLLIAILLGILSRFERPDANRYVHVGWITALLAGAVTWVAAQEIISISGAARELLEGVVALLAAAVLFSVSYWFLSQVTEQKWVSYIKKKMEKEMGAGRLMALAGISFLAVYREVFETILFYQALLLEAAGNTSPVWMGTGFGFLVLIVLTFLILKAGKKLPLGPFFAGSGVLLYIICVILVGNGMHSLAEAGLIRVAPLSIPAIPWIGLYPEMIGTVLQVLLVLAALLWGSFKFLGQPPNKLQGSQR